MKYILLMSEYHQRPERIRRVCSHTRLSRTH